MNAMHSDKPFSQACENNKRPILAVLEKAFSDSYEALEIGSGTGQHAAFFAQHLPDLIWHTSDQSHYHSGINRYLDDAQLPNARRPITFKVGEDHFPALSIDAVYTANTAHIMQRDEVALMMKLIAQHLPTNGVFCQYGPFTVNGEFNSSSNRDFHHQLIAQGYGGYRDIEELVSWSPDLTLDEVITMPANNTMLVWRKS